MECCLGTLIEELSEEVHKAYCNYQKEVKGKEYWTGGDYSRLTNEVKEADRYTVRAVLKKLSEKGMLKTDIQATDLQAEHRPIQIWPFEDAPLEYQELSKHGGDEDWVAYVPWEIWDAYYLPFLDVPHFGCCNVSEHILMNGDVVLIATHA